MVFNMPEMKLMGIIYFAGAAARQSDGRSGHHREEATTTLLILPVVDTVDRFKHGYSSSSGRQKIRELLGYIEYYIEQELGSPPKLIGKKGRRRRRIRANCCEDMYEYVPCMGFPRCTRFTLLRRMLLRYRPGHFDEAARSDAVVGERDF